ncbi:hypothetical protein GCM10027180_13030 [Microbulbifer echini]
MDISSRGVLNWINAYKAGAFKVLAVKARPPGRYESEANCGVKKSFNTSRMNSQINSNSRMCCGHNWLSWS